MKLKIFSITIAFLISVSVFSQVPTYQWANGFGASSIDEGYSVRFDGAGNVYTCGKFRGTVDFDPGAGTFNMTSAGSDDIFISKLDVSGNFVWAKQIGGASGDYASALTLDATGNIYITGSFGLNVDFDPGVGVFNMNAPIGLEAFVLKLNSIGNFVWATQIGGPGNGTQSKSISVDATGNVHIVGYFTGTSDFDPSAGTLLFTAAGNFDIFITKLNSSGNYVWSKQFSGGNDSDNGEGIVVDGAGNVYTVGRFEGTVDFDPGPGVYTLTVAGGAGDVDIFISKLNASGNFVWAKRIGGVTADEGYSIALDASNNVYTTGRFNTTVDFDPGAGTFNLTASMQNAFVSKLDASGNFVYAKQLGGAGNSFGYSVFVDALGNIYSTGLFTSTCDFDPGAGTFNLTPLGVNDVFISKLDSSGNFALAGQLGNIGAVCRGNSICADINGTMLLTGRFSGTSDFDPGVGIANITSVAGSSDIFIGRYTSCASAPSQPTSISGLNSMCTGAGASSYSVVTVAGATSYTWSLPGGWSGTSATNTISATPGSTGIFSVTASNACGTSPQQTLNVTVDPLPTITVNSGSICSGQSFTIVPSGASTYTFSIGPVVSPTTTSSYSVTGTSSLGCVSSSPAISNVTVNPLPTINAITSSSVICGPPGQQTCTLTASGASTYTWNPGGTGTSIAVSPSVTSTYTVTGTDVNGCTNTAILTQSVSACTSVMSSVVETSQLNIYPNPTSGLVTLSGVEGPVAISVYNVLGELILTERLLPTATANLILDISQQPNGIYFIKIGSETKKIIKQ